MQQQQWLHAHEPGGRYIVTTYSIACIIRFRIDGAGLAIVLQKKRQPLHPYHHVPSYQYVWCWTLQVHNDKQKQPTTAC